MTKVSDISLQDTVKVLNTKEVVEDANSLAELRMTKHPSKQLAYYDTEAKIRKAFEVKKMRGGLTFLIYRGTADEATFDAPGVLLDYHLPPFRHRRLNQATMNWFAAIGAPPDCTYMDKIQDAIQLLFLYFKESFPEGALKKYPCDVFAGFKGLCPITRAATSAEWNIFHAAPIPDGVDDYGHLETLLAAGGKYIHTEDNIIRFSQLEMIDGMDPVMKSVPPSAFRVSHLVQSTVSFRTVKVGHVNAPLIHLNKLILLGRLGTKLLEDNLKRLQDSTIGQKGEDFDNTLIKCRFVDDSDNKNDFINPKWRRIIDKELPFANARCDDDMDHIMNEG
ncbi:hypothetical protein DXG01_002423 [Tephrocybe rancida]|nr:hypothetical protein DXG01_002423 [Tephrocybe rancida]